MKLKFLLFFFTISICNAQVSDFKNIDFTVADNIAKLNQGKSLENLPILAHQLTNKLSTDVEKFRAIYTWVCNNIIGDSSVENKIIRKRKKFKNDSIEFINWNNQYRKTAFNKLLKHKKTMCTGYAYLIKELCFLTNIDCVIIDGYGRSSDSNIETLDMVNHSWNAVKLNNKWYLCDASWSSGYFLNNYFLKDYNDGYFLTDPVLFAKNHYPLNEKWLLTDSTNKIKFISSPIVYGDTFEHQTIPILPEKLNIYLKKNEEIEFSFKTLKTISTDSVSLIQYVGNNEQVFKIDDIKNENGELSFNYQFENKGLYDVHVKIDNDIVASYSLDVHK